MDYPTNDEYLAQTDDDIFAIAQLAVNLAVAVLLIHTEDAIQQAVEILGTYGDWRHIELPTYLKRILMVRNYGEEEVAAMEEEGKFS